MNNFFVGYSKCAQSDVTEKYEDIVLQITHMLCPTENNYRNTCYVGYSTVARSHIINRCAKVSQMQILQLIYFLWLPITKYTETRFVNGHAFHLKINLII